MSRRRKPPVTAKRRVLARLLHGDRTGLAAARRAGVRPRTDGTVLLVYSVGSAATVRRLVDDATDEGWDVRLWALDEEAPRLADFTVGVGRGSKYTLLNRLQRTVDEDRAGPLVLADDDVELVHGSLGWAAGIAERTGLEVFQPAHTYDSVVSWRLTYRRPATVARRTDFVEIGPISLLDRLAVERLFPLDDSIPMSGGIDWAWRRLHPDLRYGIVDAVTFRHLRPLGRTYARRDGYPALEAELARAGISDPSSEMRTIATWRAWEPAPVW